MLWVGPRDLSTRAPRQLARDNTGVDRDWIRVEVEYRHLWITEFLCFNASTTWSGSATMRVEPVT